MKYPHPHPHPHRGKAWAYTAIVLAMTPVVAVGLPIASLFIAKLIVDVRGGAGPQYVSESTAWAIIIVWVIALPGIILGGIYYALMAWRRFSQPCPQGVCEKCGYDLRGCGPESNCCPECGRAFAGANR